MRQIASILALQVLVNAGLPQPRPDAAAMPKKFVMALNGFMGAGKGVLLEKGVLVYTIYGRNGSPERKEIRPTPEQWRRFRQALETIDIWRWRADYPNPAVADGLRWEIDLAYADRTVHATGANNYPDDAGRPTGSATASNAFDRLCAAIRELLGDPNF
jgi:hypothetical protein